MDGLADGTLVAAWQEGDDRAFDAIYVRYAGRLTGYATRMLGRPEEAEEVVVDAFATFVERGPRDGDLRPWLFTVVHRACLDRLRRRQRVERLLGLFWRAPAPPPTPLDRSLATEEHRRLAAALEALPAEHRAALLLSAVQELPAREVGAILGLGEQQVRSQVSYARKRLREVMS